MKIKVKNLGILRQAEFELGDLTIICGSNNSGKTYATYALFGFLLRWKGVFQETITRSIIKKLSAGSLLESGSLSIDINDYIADPNRLIEQASVSYTEDLPRVFAAEDKAFADSKFLVSVSDDNIKQKVSEKKLHRTGSLGGKDGKNLFVFDKEAGSLQLDISLATERHDVEIANIILAQIIAEIIIDAAFSDLFPNPFIASAERTGAAIFRKELNFARNRLLEEMTQTDKNIDPLQLLFKEYKDYAIPVKRNVDFTRQLETVVKENSFLLEKHADILDNFADIIGGKYTISSQDQIHFQPKGTKVKLTMDESSSAVRSLLDIGFYLRHVVKHGDILMIDEPELNLHPENQRKIARLFARLVNVGIKVFITTHSDYIVKELNTLIMLNQDKPYLKRIAERERYDQQELLKPEQVKVHIAGKASTSVDGLKNRTQCHTLTPAKIDTQGIEVSSFDTAIDEMNRIQSEIMWGDDE